MIAHQNDNFWPITAEHRQEAVDALMEILNSDDTPLAIRAARILIAMDLSNLKAEQTEGVGLRNAILKMAEAKRIK